MSDKISVELFLASNCNRCKSASMHVHRVIDAYTAEQLVYREINVLDDLEYAVSLGVLVTPAIAIDGVLVFSGLPTVSRLRLEVQARLGSSGAN